MATIGRLISLLPTQSSPDSSSLSYSNPLTFEEVQHSILPPSDFKATREAYESWENKIWPQTHTYSTTTTTTNAHTHTTNATNITANIVQEINEHNHTSMNTDSGRYTGHEEVREQQKNTHTQHTHGQVL